MVLSDSRIVELFFAREESAIEALLAKYGKLLFRIAHNILGDARDAEECRADAAMAVWNTVPPKRPDPLGPYVCRILRNLAIDRYRYNGAEKRYSGGEVLLSEIEDIVCDKDSLTDAPTPGEIASAVSDFLRTQTATDRRLFIRRYFHGDSVGDVAADAGITENAASVKLYRLRAKLKKYLGERGIEV